MSAILYRDQRSVIMINPFTSAAEFLSKSAHQRQKILDTTNRVSQPYFHSVVRGIEDPSLKESIVQAIGRQTESQQKEATQLRAQIKEDPFASKQLYNRSGLVEFGNKLLEDIQKMSFNRTSPALTQEEPLALPPATKRNQLGLHEPMPKPPMNDLSDLVAVLNNPMYGSQFKELMTRSMPINPKYPKSWTLASQQRALLDDIQTGSTYANVDRFAREHQADILAVAQRIIDAQRGFIEQEQPRIIHRLNA